VQNRLPDRLAKATEPQVAPINLEDVSPIEFLKDKTKGIGVLRATDAGAVLYNATFRPDADVARRGSRGGILVIATKDDVTMLREVIQVLGGTR
jgi:hypothetical protein